MVDNHFEHPRLVALYDRLDHPDRPDLDPYLRIAEDLGARRILDVGCGTGTLALRFAEQGLLVTGVDPAAGSLAFARTRPGADRVNWLHGDATGPLPQALDLVTMTGNVAQAIHDPAAWAASLRRIRAALRPGGHLVFETRDPARRGWLEWTRAASFRTDAVPAVGVVESWVELTDLNLRLVSFRGTWVFTADGTVLTSDSTLRFRERDEIEDDLRAAGYDLVEVRDAPDRPGREFVVLARRPD
jgi:SAM-dependent methyltransferase